MYYLNVLFISLIWGTICTCYKKKYKVYIVHVMCSVRSEHFMDYSVILLLANLKYNDYINFAIDLLNYVSCVQHTRMHEIFPSK